MSRKADAAAMERELLVERLNRKDTQTLSDIIARCDAWGDHSWKLAYRSFGSLGPNQCALARTMVEERNAAAAAAR